MSPRRFLFKLAAFFLPLAAVFALPFAILAKSYEILPVSMIAAAHAKAPRHAVYGAAYNNPDKGYKVVALKLRQPPIAAVGSSRVMQFRSDFFSGGEATFYNCGGSITRIFDFRPLFTRLRTAKTRHVIFALDQWVFNAAWSGYPPDPGVGAEYDGEYDALDTLQRSLITYTDLRTGKLSLQKLFVSSESFGVNGITRGNGFERDGSYFYKDRLAKQRSEPGFHDEDVFERIRTGTRRFEFGDKIAEGALVELRMLVEQLQRDGYEVIAFLPPFAPSVLDTMRKSGRLGYVFQVASRVQPILEELHVPFVDFTACGDIQCVDDDFLDGFHGGAYLYAKIAMKLAEHAPWLAESLARASLERRLTEPHEAWTLPYDEGDH